MDNARLLTFLAFRFDGPSHSLPSSSSSLFLAYPIFSSAFRAAARRGRQFGPSVTEWLVKPGSVGSVTVESNVPSVEKLGIEFETGEDGSPEGDPLRGIAIPDGSEDQSGSP
jgi:hypothetical protein